MYIHSNFREDFREGQRGGRFSFEREEKKNEIIFGIVSCALVCLKAQRVYVMNFCE